MAFSVHYTYFISDRYTSKLAKIRKATDRFRASAKRAQQATKNFSNRMLSAQNIFMSVGGAIGGVAVLGQFVAFETAMNKLASVALTSDKNVSIFRKTAMALGRTTKFTATQVAQGMTQLKLAGMKVGQIKNAIGPTLDLAAAGGLEISQAAIIATDALGAMQLKIKDLPKVMDILGLAQSKAKFDIFELAGAMKTSAATAQFLGFDLSKLTALLGTMAKSGLRDSIAGTLFRNALTKISAASGKTLARFRKLGINLDEFRTKTGKLKNFDKFIEKLRQAEKQGKLTAGRMQDLFGIRGFRAIQALMVQGGMKFFKEFDTALNKSSGTIKRMVEIQMRGLPGALLEFKSAVEAVNISLFGKGGLAGFLEKVIDRMTKFLRKLSEASPKTLRFIAILGTVAVVGGPALLFLGLLSGSMSSIIGVSGALIGILPKFIGLFQATTIVSTSLNAAMAGGIVKIGFFSKILGFLLSPAVLITGAIAILAGGLVYLAIKSQKVRDSLKGLWNAIKVIFSPFKALFSLFGPAFSILYEVAKSFDFVAFAAGAVSGTIDVLTKMVEFLLIPFKALEKLIKGIGNIIGAVFKGITGKKGIINELGELVFGGPKQPSSSFDERQAAVQAKGARAIKLLREMRKRRDEGVAAQGARATAGTLNGRIGIDVTGPGRVTSSEINTSVPGDLGFNMGGG